MPILEMLEPPVGPPTEVDRVKPSRARAILRESHGIHRILVCLDRSPFSEVCVPYATFMSRIFGSSITLLHVMQPARGRSGAQATDALGWEISRQEAGAYLERYGKEAAAASGHRVETRLEQGLPAERIRAVAHDLRADLTVLATYGEGGATAWTLGSTTQQVLALAQGSVFVARSETRALGTFSPRHILVPLDGSLRTESTLPVAVRIAKSTGAEILLAHVVPELVLSSVLR